VLHESTSRAADPAFSTFGNVHVLSTTGEAGGSGLPVWEAPLRDWDWVFGVNFMGVLHGIRAFVPRMLENGEAGHIVNTASVAGLLTGADPYSVSKHGVVCLTEGLYKQFRAINAKLSASVLCPGWVNTQILDAERNRPTEFGPANDRSETTPEQQQRRAMVEQFVKSGFAPDEVAEQVLDAVLNDRFYIIPAQDHIKAAVKQRFDDLLAGNNPTVSLL